MCLFITCMPGAHGIRQRASDPCKLKLQMVVRHRVVLGTQVLCENIECFSPLSLLFRSPTQDLCFEYHAN